MRILTFSFALLIVIGSCTSASHKGSELNTGKTKVKIDNQNVMSMTIYVLKGSQKLRLGRVSGLTTRVFDIPNLLVSGPTSLQLMADPIGSQHSPLSEEFSIVPGDLIEMVIRPF